MQVVARLNLGEHEVCRPACQCLKLPSDDILMFGLKAIDRPIAGAVTLSQNFDNRQIAVVLCRRGI